MITVWLECCIYSQKFPLWLDPGAAEDCCVQEHAAQSALKAAKAFDEN